MANNQYVNKVSFNSTVLIDLTSDTAVASDVAQGKYFHLATGERVEGTAPEAAEPPIWQDADGYVHVSDTVDAPVGIYSDDGYVVLDVEPAEPSLQSKTYTVDSAGTETITADSGYDGLSSVAVSVPSADPWIGYDTGYSTNGSNKRIWTLTPNVSVDVSQGDTAGFMADGYTKSAEEWYECYAVPANTTVTPTTSAQTIGGAGYMMEGAVTVAAMPSGTAGTPTATKGTVSNHAVSVTPSVTNSAGYISGGTKTGTAVSVSASELVSGTYTVDSSGTKDVTNYASASVAAGSATASATKGSVSNHSVTVTPSVTRTAGWVTAGSANGTAVSVSASELVSGSQTITENDTYDVTNLASVVVNVSGGGSTGLQIDSVDAEIGSASSSITFTGLQAEPTSFVIYPDSDKSTGSPANVVAVVFDGTTIHGQTASTTSNANAHYDTGFTKSYSNGTLTVTATSASFPSDYWMLDYTYGGSSSDIYTSDVQVGSGATSITFTGLEDEPIYWSCIFKSNFGTSSGYQRVMWLRKSSSNIYGACMDSSANLMSSYWTSSYSNGSLTITSNGTNQGGYFHQPGYYQLTYVVGGEASPYQAKTVTPTTSQQVVTPDTGYDALSSVTVNAIPSTYVQPTSTVGATTYRPSTTIQTIQAGTYHSGAGTIAAVTQTNLSAENIKSGTTITIGNGQSNLWSVTGTYSGGGSSSSYEFIASTSYSVNTSSTTSISVGTFETGEPSIWTSDKLVYVKIRDTAGWRANHFYGMDAFMTNNIPAAGLTGTSSYMWFGRGYSMNASYKLSMPSMVFPSTPSAANGYGIYPTFLYDDGSIEIEARYSSSSPSTQTIDGTFSIEVYLLDWPGGVSPFN